MAEKEKFVIEVFKKKEPEELTKALADPEARPALGSAAALCGGEACALALRAVRLSAVEGERRDYLERNIETLRGYLLHLIDEDIRCCAPYRKALKNEDAERLEPALHTACAITNEIVNQMGNLLTLLEELSLSADAETAVYLGSAAQLALAAAKSARYYLLRMAQHSEDETWRYVVRRENELSFAHYEEQQSAILRRVEELLSVV